MKKPPAKKRPSRAKASYEWEQIELALRGLYSDNLHELSARFPELTPQELRLCALLKAMMTSRQIAGKLSIEESSVERYRLRLRRKLGLNNKENLTNYLNSH